MNMYTWLMAIVLALALFMHGYKSNNKKYIWISCFLMFAVCGLRDVLTLGNDSASSYLHLFQNMESISIDELSQFGDGEHNAGFYLLVHLFSKYSHGNYQLFIIVYSAFVMAVFARFISKYSTNPVQSFVYFWGLLCYIFLFDSLKQGIAMAFVTLAFDAIIEKKPIKFTLIVLFGSLFHLPALVFLPAYWIASMKPGRGYLFTLVAMLALTYIFREKILELMLSVYGTELQMHEMRFLANKVLIMIVIVVAAMVLRPPTKDDRLYTILLQLMGVAIVIQTFASYNNTFERLANYYFQFSVVFIPMVFQMDCPRSPYLDIRTEAFVKQLAPWLFCAFGVWRFANYIQANDWLWLPYRFFFE